MKLDNLKKALEHYVLSADCPADERQDIFDAIAECNELKERYADRDMWKDCVYLVSASSLSDLLNHTTYDDFGKLARVHGNDVPFDYYAGKVRQWFLSDMTNRSLQLGYDIVHDLWGDNEAYGNNNPDGTFKLSDTLQHVKAEENSEYKEAESIQRVLNDCMEAPGDTSIKIIVERNGQTTVANLYDHAALVTSLYDTLEYFKSEL